VGAALHRRWVRLRWRGHEVECPCCGREWAAFVPDWNRPDAICPGCGSHERHRALSLHLRDRLGAGEAPLRMLHFAPEHALTQRLERVPELERVTADLDAHGVDVAADITALPFDDASFDAVLCSHVLEHVEDDRAAMAELARVLRPGGWLVVLVPIDLNRTHTYEDPSIVDPDERERAFWQHDHVRLYAPDIAERLRDAGLEVHVERPAGELPAGSVARHGLLPGELIFHCTRPPSLEA
jgi:SAM-dependent methyltransferase